ncbi:DUF2243 domain-containing protein [Halodurantibacterium flavum]|uniref:DUF2243 domain-containing protein n=1 Tax=Halodurantibacterium flavum TaxID=1382802 RepID=A0ABW4S6N8_9RHOB
MTSEIHGATPPDERLSGRRRIWGALLLGVSLGGFFDGILLHQILQWHHLLSGLEGTGPLGDLRFQVMADGLFHAVHYVLAVLGMVLIFGHPRHAGAGRGRTIAGWAAIGFGGWHCFDALFSHWLLGIHRIRMDSPNPLVWDMIWFVLFGLLPLGLGLWMLRGEDGGDHQGRGRRTALSLAILAMTAAPVAALPAGDMLPKDHVLVVFRPGMDFAQIVAAVDAVEGRMIWTDVGQGVWLISVSPGQGPGTLYRHGAMLVTGTGPAVGCLDWMRPAA